MTKPVITIRYATIDDVENVANFRIEQFKSAKEFEIVSTELISELKGQVIIAELDNVIISTMQFQTLANREELVKCETAYIPDIFDGFQTCYLSKGATSKEFRNTGINSYLRMIILNYAVQNNRINSMTGTAYKSAPRMNVLKRIGYKIIETYDIIQNYFISKDTLLFLWLERDDFNSACKLLQEELQELESNYSINIQIN